MDAKVRVSGFVSAAMGVGTIEYAHMPIMPASRLGRTISGRRTMSEISVDMQIVPAMVYVAWLREACTTVLAAGTGTLLRWKYH